MLLTIDPRRTALRLAGIALLLTIAGTAGYLGQSLAGLGTPPGRFFGALRQLFRLNAEGNISSWYATALLLGCAALLAINAAVTAAAGGRFVGYWWGLSLVFAFLSLDEAIAIHESLGGWVRAVIDTWGLFVYAWVIPYTAFAAIVALTCLRFLASLPRSIARLFVLAGALYVGGAVGFETLQGQVARFREEGNLALAVLAATVAVEEVLEMLGAVLFIYALLAHLAKQNGRVRFGAFVGRPARGAEDVLIDHFGQHLEPAAVGAPTRPVPAPPALSLKSHPDGQSG